MSLLKMDVINEKNVEEQEKTLSSSSSVKMQFLAAVICSMLAFMYGNTIGWTSAAVPKIESGILSDGPITSESSGWVGGAFCLGALVSSPFYGLLADARGRKFAAYVVGLCFVTNWIIISSTNSFSWILVARVFAGAAGAGSITVVSIYNNEISELRIRTAIGGILALVYVFGIESAYIFGAYLSYKTITLVCLSICLVWFPLMWVLPETPAHLVLHGREKEALLAIRWLQRVDEIEANGILAQLREEQAGAKDSATIKEFFSDPAAMKALFLVSLLITFQSFSGSFAINSYVGSIFSKTGGNITPETGAMIIGVAMIVGAMIPPVLSNRAPRKVLLCSSTFMMGAGMATFGTFQLIKSWMSSSDQDSIPSFLPPLILSLTICSYFFGLGSIPYMSATELFSDENRGVAGAIISLVTWSTCFILLQFFGLAVETFGDYNVFYFFTCVIYSCFFFILIFLPETKGKSFPEIRKTLVKNNSQQNKL